MMVVLSVCVNAYDDESAKELADRLKDIVPAITDVLEAHLHE